LQQQRATASVTEGPPECDPDASVDAGVWRFAKASRVRVVVDAADYFDLMQQAMLKARRRVLMIGWDFDTRIHLTRGRRWWQKGWKSGFPSRLGGFIPWLVRHRPELEIRILKWGMGLLRFGVRGPMMFDLVRWFPHKRIDFKLDTAHPMGCSHHQKIVVIDRSLAVCGGIDMTDRRWDTPEHREHDPRRKRPHGGLHGPWHDVTMMMEGEVAAVLEELGRDRWRRAGGRPLDPPPLDEASAWPDELNPTFEDVEIGIARTRAAYKGEPKINEIEQLFVEHIGRAKRFIYAENQYFASRVIAEAISRRLVEDDPPEIVIVQPASADGWIESQAMDPARALLAKAVREIDRHDRFHLYTPYAGETPIYVHAKLLIVDDEVLRIGSANFNNRSLGLDSECDVFIDCARPTNSHCSPAIRELRHRLLAEHCDLLPTEVGRLQEEAGSIAGMIAALGPGRTHTLRPFHPAELNELQADMAARELLDPEEPAEMFLITPPRRGLFRRGSLLSRAMTRLKNKRRRALGSRAA
jgi:phosphatidylserine/phosphatidylglycerophosphate/cardiolipin synthase-like enzyme